MGVATKNRRKITLNDRQYVWHVAEDRDGKGLVLHITSTNKQFIAMHLLNQSEGKDYIVILGRRFAGAITGGNWRRFLCPHFAADSVTPRGVRQLIEWCLDEQVARQEIDLRSHAFRL